MTRDDRKAALTEVHQLLHEEYHEMTRDDIIRLAREAQEVPFKAGSNVWVFSTEGLERFANLVAASEREKFCVLLRTFHDSLSCASDVTGVQGRGDK